MTIASVAVHGLPAVGANAPAVELDCTVTLTGVLAVCGAPAPSDNWTVIAPDAVPAVKVCAGDWKARRLAAGAEPPNAVVLFGVPRPVGPSYPVPAVHRYEPAQLPLLPLKISKRELRSAYGAAP